MGRGTRHFKEKMSLKASDGTSRYPTQCTAVASSLHREMDILASSCIPREIAWRARVRGKSVGSWNKYFTGRVVPHQVGDDSSPHVFTINEGDSSPDFSGFNASTTSQLGTRWRTSSRHQGVVCSATLVIFQILFILYPPPSLVLC
jgi:hypothetical protein